MTEHLYDRLPALLKHAYKNAPAVKEIFNQASISPDDIQSLEDLQKIPVTSKDRLVEMQRERPPFGGFLAVPPDKLSRVFLSPGPLYEPSTGDNPAWESIRLMLSLAGFTSEDVVLNTFGYHLIPTGIALDQILREMNATVIPAGVGNADLQVKMMHELGVTGYVGTPSWLMALLKKAEEVGLTPQKDLSLRTALVSAEPLPPPLRHRLVSEYGIKITNAYGTAELGFLAYDQVGGLEMRLLETAIIQVVHPDSGKTVNPGEAGEVVVTTFNPTYPLIRFGTGDLAVNVDPNPGKSRQGERSIILVGRLGEAVKVRGMFIHPNQLNFAFRQVSGLVRAQAIVSREAHRDILSLRVVLTQDSDEERSHQVLLQTIQAICRVKVDHIECVSPDAIPENSPLIRDVRTWE
ncbi:MAG: AMP-binding protein [Chloroflexota bacterium]